MTDLLWLVLTCCRHCVLASYLQLISPLHPVYQSCLFGPLGATLRYYLSSKNKSHTLFPVYTFVANMTGAVGICVLFALTDRDDASSPLDTGTEVV
jgi:hypothetical protein